MTLCGDADAVTLFGVLEPFQNEAPSRSHTAASLLDRLRTETLPVHQRLEQDLDLLGSPLSLSSYRDTLKSFYGFYKPYEEAVYAGMPSELTSVFCNRRKTPGLVDDLRFFQMEPADCPLCFRLPQLDRLPAVLGALYVTEGATLGGQIISRHVEAALSLAPGAGASFFSAYGQQTGSMWKAFRNCLLDYSSPLIDDAIVQGAFDTFSVMHRWLCPGKLPV